MFWSINSEIIIKRYKQCKIYDTSMKMVIIHNNKSKCPFDQTNSMHLIHYGNIYNTCSLLK